MLVLKGLVGLHRAVPSDFREMKIGALERVHLTVSEMWHLTLQILSGQVKNMPYMVFVSILLFLFVCLFVS